MMRNNTKKSIRVIALISCMLVAVFMLAGCGPKETAFKDSTAKLESSASKGSLTTVSGKYNIQGLKGNYAVYSKNGKGLISQHGTYKFKDGKIALTYTLSGTAMDYSLKQSDDKKSTTLKNGKIKLVCTYENGTAGLNKAKDKFTGTYKLGENTYMVFKDNGTFRQVQTFKYKISGHKIALTFGKDTQKYTWKTSGNKILIQQKGTTLDRLVPTSK